MSSCGSNTGMETSTSLVNAIAIANNVLFHSDSHISQTLPQITHILRCCLVVLLPYLL